MSVGTVGYLEARLEKRQKHFFPPHTALNHQEIRHSQALIRALQLPTFHTYGGMKAICILETLHFDSLFRLLVLN